MVLSLTVLASAGELYNIIAGRISNGGLAAWLLVFGSLWIVLAARPHVLGIRKPDLIYMLIPFIFHAFALVAGLGAGIFARQPILAVIELGMVSAGILLHRATYQVKAPLEVAGGQDS